MQGAHFRIADVGAIKVPVITLPRLPLLIHCPDRPSTPCYRCSNHAGLHVDKTSYVSAVERKILHLLAGNHPAQHSVGGVEQGRGGIHFHRRR